MNGAVAIAIPANGASLAQRPTSSHVYPAQIILRRNIQTDIWIDVNSLEGHTPMPIHLFLLLGEECVSDETITRAKAVASDIIEKGGSTPEEAKKGFDRWRAMTREERAASRSKNGPDTGVKRLYDLWVAADDAAETVLEESLADSSQVCGELMVSDE